MSILLISNLDGRLTERLRDRAAREGVSVEEEARRILEDRLLPEAKGGEAQPPPQRTEEERQDLVRRMLAFGRPLDEPFDLKAFCDDLWDPL